MGTPNGSTRRLKLALAVIGALAAFTVTGASAADFESDSGPCTETKGEAALLRCTTGYVGTEYELEIETEDGSGCTPNVWFEIRNGGLPPGLSMTRAGVISGTPTGTGLFRFWVWVHDLTAAQGGPSWCAFDDQSEREFSIPIEPGLAIVTPDLEPGTLGRPYSKTLATKQVRSLNPPTGPDVAATWSVSSGALPPGLSLAPSGLLAGTPTAEGKWEFELRAQSAGLSTTEKYSIAVRTPVTVKSPFPSPLPARTEIGVPVEESFAATGGSGSYAWSLTSGALPAGVTLSASNGLLSGRPTAPGRFPVTVTATDTEGRTGTSGVVLTVAPRLAITTSRLKPATLGSAYRARIATAGGVSPLSWKATGKLPRGVRLAKKAGWLVGSPIQLGTFRVTLEARDVLGVKAKQKVVLEVRPR